MLTSQALTLCVALFIFLLIFIMKTVLMKEYKILAIGVLIILPIIVLKIYTVQCIINGNCIVYGWVLAGLALFVAVVYTALFINKIIKNKQKNDIMLS
jgi:hypothetical protein